MTRTKKIILSLVLIVSALFVLNWCRGGVVRNNTYSIGIDSSWYPLNLQGKERNMLGFVHELLKHIAGKEGIRVRFVDVGPHSLEEGLRRGNYDAMISSLIPNPYTRSIYTFSDPFYLVGPVLIVRVGENIYSLDQMNGRIVGLTSGGLQVFKADKHPRILFVPFDRPATLLENLLNYTIDGVIMDALPAYIFSRGYYKGRVEIATAPLTDKGLRLVGLADPRAMLLIEKFDHGLNQLIEDGGFDLLLEKWGLIDTERRKAALEEMKKRQLEEAK